MDDPIVENLSDVPLDKELPDLGSELPIPEIQNPEQDDNPEPEPAPEPEPEIKPEEPEAEPETTPEEPAPQVETEIKPEPAPEPAPAPEEPKTAMEQDISEITPVVTLEDLASLTKDLPKTPDQPSVSIPELAPISSVLDKIQANDQILPDIPHAVVHTIDDFADLIGNTDDDVLGNSQDDGLPIFHDPVLNDINMEANLMPLPSINEDPSNTIDSSLIPDIHQVSMDDVFVPLPEVSDNFAIPVEKIVFADENPLASFNLHQNLKNLPNPSTFFHPKSEVNLDISTPAQVDNDVVNVLTHDHFLQNGNFPTGQPIQPENVLSIAPEIKNKPRKVLSLSEPKKVLRIEDPVDEPSPRSASHSRLNPSSVPKRKRDHIVEKSYETLESGTMSDVDEPDDEFTPDFSQIAWSRKNQGRTSQEKETRESHSSKSKGAKHTHKSKKSRSSKLDESRDGERNGHKRKSGSAKRRSVSPRTPSRKSKSHKSHKSASKSRSSHKSASKSRSSRKSTPKSKSKTKRPDSSRSSRSSSKPSPSAPSFDHYTFHNLKTDLKLLQAQTNQPYLGHEIPVSFAYSFQRILSLVRNSSYLQEPPSLWDNEKSASSGSEYSESGSSGSESDSGSDHSQYRYKRGSSDSE